MSCGFHTDVIGKNKQNDEEDVLGSIIKKEEKCHADYEQNLMLSTCP